MLRSRHDALGLPPVVIGAALLALALKLWLALTTFGTTDVRTFLYFLLQDRAGGVMSVYEQVKDFNHPPTILPALRVIHGVAEATGIPFSFWLRLPAIAADVGTVLVVASRLRPAGASARASLALCAAAPVSVIVSGFHGNSDPVMIFLVVLSAALLERGRPAWLAGVAFGLALDVKVVPLVFGPALLLWLPDWRRRAAYFGTALGVVLATWAPVLVEAPGLVARRVLGYASSYGVWGLSRGLSAVGPLAPASELFRDHGRLLLAGAIVALSLWMNRGGRRPGLLRQLALVAFAFLALTPGFGVQYLAWLVPFTAALPLAASAAFHATSGAFLLAVYTFWCQRPPGAPGDPDWLGAAFWSRGLPWNIANANRTGPWRGELVLLEAACWLAVVGALAVHLRAAAAERGAGRRPPTGTSPAPSRESS